MKNQLKQASLVILTCVLAVVAAFGIANLNQTEAAAVVGSTKSVAENPTILPTAATYGTPFAHSEYGTIEMWANATAIPTAFAGTLVVQQSASQGGPYVSVTPTVISGSGTITYATRATPFVVKMPTNGLYTRWALSNTSAVSSGLSIRTIGKNIEE